MSKARALGGIAPYGYRWEKGKLVIDAAEAPTRKLIFELFLKHRRKKTVAKILNELGYRTRSASRFSDTTVDRLLRDTTAKGLRTVNGTATEVEAIIPVEMWDRVNKILGESGSAKQTSHLFTGKAYCFCGGKMVVPGNMPKYVCQDCRHKILIEDLEEIFLSQLKRFPGSEYEELFECWAHFTVKEKRIIVEQICERIVIECDAITIRLEFGYTPHSFKAMTDEQQLDEDNKTPNPSSVLPPATELNEPLLGEVEAARFLGISKSTLLRKRFTREIGYFRVGHRVLYSKEKHLIPFLSGCEEQNVPKI